jgi:hypothetical protein
MAGQHMENLFRRFKESSGREDLSLRNLFRTQ